MNSYNPYQEQQPVPFEMPASPDLIAPGVNPDLYANAAAQAVAEAGEQTRAAQAGFNPLLMRLFLQAHGNTEASKMFAGLMVADYAAKEVIRYHQQYNPAAAEVAHAQQTIDQQVREAMPTDDNVLYPVFGKRKAGRTGKTRSDTNDKVLVAA